MTVVVSTGVKIKELAALVGTPGLSGKNLRFVTDIIRKSSNGTETRALTENQIAWIEDLHGRFFA